MTTALGQEVIAMRDTLCMLRTDLAHYTMADVDSERKERLKDDILRKTRAILTFMGTSADCAAVDSKAPQSNGSADLQRQLEDTRTQLAGAEASLAGEKAATKQLLENSTKAGTNAAAKAAANAEEATKEAEARAVEARTRLEVLESALISEKEQARDLAEQHRIALEAVTENTKEIERKLKANAGAMNERVQADLRMELEAMTAEHEALLKAILADSDKMKEEAVRTQGAAEARVAALQSENQIAKDRVREVEALISLGFRV
jgi:hypothetical protein